MYDPANKVINRFSIDNTPAEPSKDVTTDITTELGRITLGTQTSVGSAEYLSWVTVLKSMMEGTLNNVRDMAVSSLVDGTARFVHMLNELYFAAKVNSRLNLMKIKENSLRPRPTAIFQTLQSHDIPIQKSRKFLSAGSRWAFLANSVIAFMGEDNYFRKKASVTVIQALCNQIRAPISSVSGDLVKSCLIPVLANLRKDIPISMPTLYHPSLFKNLGLSSSFDSGNLNESDNYFSSFFFQDWEAWNQFLAIPEDQLLSTALLERRFLLFSPVDVGSPISELTSETSSSEEEPLARRFLAKPPLPISMIFSRMGFQSQDAEGIHQILRTPYIPQKTVEPFPADIGRRSKWTEQERRAAINCVKPDSLDKYAQEMNQRFDSLGRLSDNRYLKLDRNLVNGKVLQVYDDNQSLLYTLDTTMPANLREGLETAVQACLSDTTAQFRYQEPSTSVKTRSFSCIHFTNQTRYLTHGYNAPEDVHPLYLRNADGGKTNHSQFLCHPSEDIQKLSQGYATLKEALEAVLQWIVEKVLRIHPDMFQEILATADLLPLNDTSPASPFTSIVVNINVGTLAHRDKNDGYACICVTIGNPKGGELGMYEPKLLIETRNGDVVKMNKTEIEANYLLRIAEIQKTLYTSEKAVLDQKISLTKLILELHLHRINQIQFENSKAEETVTKMKDILLDIRKKQCTSKKGKAGTPNTPPLMELDEEFEEDIDEEDIDEEEESEESGEMEEAPLEPLEINKSQETEIRYYDQGHSF
ncbi:hypothetical protein C8R41DRAFT_867190 [Lentinula lateritia]|uniref:Uncharacterized protein n=1 Tax=Lentinula lateritia TaxID=40482 RepID=A0ABQ8VFS4_9AGAR|nr:hypothetical protein C8R41DRAFT_867190 [Lentinula lateritia]